MISLLLSRCYPYNFNNTKITCKVFNNYPFLEFQILVVLSPETVAKVKPSGEYAIFQID
jgi:hypothetical protein